jgi:hypothetical protein
VVSHEPARVGLPVFFAVMGIATAAWLGAYAAARRQPPPLAIVAGWALVFRLIGLAGQPVLEDDHYRYLWDGYVFAETGTPYGLPPIAAFGDPGVDPRFVEVLNGINHPDVPTIYGPVAELAFLLSHHVAPARLWPLKSLLVLLDLAMLALLARLVPGRELLLVAWAPLLVKEVAFTAHLEPLALAPLAAALALRARGSGPAPVAILSGIAVAARLQALLVAPLLLPRPRRRAALWFSLTIVACYLPVLGGSGVNERGGLSAFAEGWEFNSFGFGVLAAAAGDGAARATAPLLAGAVLLVVWFRNRHGRVEEFAAGLYGVAWLFAPVVNPWYLLWVLVFAAFRPASWAVAAVAVVPLAYAHGLNLPGALGAYEHPPWVRPLEFAVVAIALAADWRRLRTPARDRASPNSPRSAPTADPYSGR